MSIFDVEPEDMTNPTFIDDRLNALLANEAHSEPDGATRELALLVQQIQGAHPTVDVPPALEDRHLTAIMGAVAERRSWTDPGIATSGSRRARAAAMTWSRKLAAGTLSLSTVFGGMAYAGVLPDGLQRATAEIADAVGINLPAPADVAGDDDSTDAPEVVGGSQSARDPELHVDDSEGRIGEGGGRPRSGGGATEGPSVDAKGATGSHDEGEDEEEPQSREVEDDDAGPDDADESDREDDGPDDGSSSGNSEEDGSGGDEEPADETEDPVETADEENAGSGDDESEDSSNPVDDPSADGDSTGDSIDEDEEVTED